MEDKKAHITHIVYKYCHFDFEFSYMPEPKIISMFFPAFQKKVYVRIRSEMASVFILICLKWYYIFFLWMWLPC